MSTEEPMSTEDRVRTATRAGATLVRDIGPLAAPESARLRGRPAPDRRRWRAWGIPLAAAAAVVLVALSLVAVRQFGTPAPSAGRPVANAPATVPRYYAALDHSASEYTSSVPLIVGDDLTGTVIDTISPPHGLHFLTLTGTSDDRTFLVLAVDQAGPAPDDAVYLLRIAPGARHPYRLTELPSKLPGNDPVVLSYALSPDGRELAVESAAGTVSHASVITLGIYSVSSGAELRAWTVDPRIMSGLLLGTLFWLSNGRQLAFSVPNQSGGPYPEDQLRTLDVTSPGTDLMAASRALFPGKSPLSSPSDCSSMYLTPDGGTVICGSQYSSRTPPGTSAGCANGGLEFTAYSVRTGKPVRVLYQYRGACSNGDSSVLWTSASATTVIGATEINVANQGGKQTGQLGVITGGHIRLLKLPKSVSPTDYATVAF